MNSSENSQASSVRTSGLPDERIRIPVLEEVLVVEKKLRIKEEIHITKTTRNEHKSEVVSLKSEEISMERFDERGPDASDDA